jgi:hypothetical protein
MLQEFIAWCSKPTMNLKNKFNDLITRSLIKIFACFHIKMNTIWWLFIKCVSFLLISIIHTFKKAYAKKKSSYTCNFRVNITGFSHEANYKVTVKILWWWWREFKYIKIYAKCKFLQYKQDHCEISFAGRELVLVDIHELAHVVLKQILNAYAFVGHQCDINFHRNNFWNHN